MRIMILSILALCTALVLSAAARVPTGLIPLGSGTVRYLGFISVYQATLYGKPDMPIDDVLDDHYSRCLELTYEVALDAEKFVIAADTVLKRQHAATSVAQVREHIDTLHRAYQAVEPGDRYLLCYNADSGTSSLTLNDTKLAVIHSPEFAHIYFGIWLGEKEPLSKALRTQLTAGASNREK